MTDKKDWLLFVHIGPVQDFIMSARRCRDLWYGSKLLSELSRTTAKAIQLGSQSNDKNYKLIFPNSVENDESGIANKIVVKLEQMTSDECTAIAEGAREAMRTELTRRAAEAFEGPSKSKHFQSESANEHINTLMEFMWVAVPIEADEKDYVDARKKGDKLLAARKNTRNWELPKTADPGIPKSSLDGVRESVIHEDAYDKKKSERMSAYARRQSFGVNKEERLCGVGVLKRLGKFSTKGEPDETPVFHSAGHIASAGLRRRIFSSAKAQEAWADYYTQLEQELGRGINDLRIGAQRKGSWKLKGVTVPSTLAIPGKENSEFGLDGILLYPSRLKDLADVYNDAGKVFKDKTLQELRQKQEALLRAIDVSDPYPYYAVLVADGDKMGKAIDTLKTSKEHQSFSENLDKEFAQKADGVIHEHGGSLIFAGGDDVIALLPLCTALQASRALRDLFKDAMKSAGLVGVEAPTLSVGLGITHFLTDFAEARALAKRAETLAKESGRNRLAIILDKRGGVPRQIVGEWKEDKDLCIDGWLESLADLLEQANIPRGFSHQLLESIRFAELEKDKRALDEVLLSLARRVVLRRELKPEHKEAFLKYLSPSQDELKKVDSAFDLIQEFANQLLIANEFRQAKKDAGLYKKDKAEAETEAAE